MDIVRTDAFIAWVRKEDHGVRAAVARRLANFERGLFGDAKLLNPPRVGVWEARIHFGAGYRLYFMKEGQAVIVMLGGGDKRSQVMDIIDAMVAAKARKT